MRERKMNNDKKTETQVEEIQDELVLERVSGGALIAPGDLRLATSSALLRGAGVMALQSGHHDPVRIASATRFIK
jgi:hypothetical protein